MSNPKTLYAVFALACICSINDYAQASDTVDCDRYHSAVDEYFELGHQILEANLSGNSQLVYQLSDKSAQLTTEIMTFGPDSGTAMAEATEIMLEAYTNVILNTHSYSDAELRDKFETSLAESKRAFYREAGECVETNNYASDQLASPSPENVSVKSESPLELESNEQQAEENLIRDIQMVLNKCGFDVGTPDGLWGPRTRKGAQEYVKSHGVKNPAFEKTDLIVQVDSFRAGDYPCILEDTSVAAADPEQIPQTPAQPDLSNSDKSDSQLVGSDFSNTNLSQSNFENADLTLADMSDANLSGSQFSNATLIRSNLQNANLSDTDFSNANLAGANLKGATLDGANFEGADMYNVDMQDATFENVSFKNAVLSKANMVGADLRKAVMEGASLAGAALKSARFSVATGLTIAQVSTAKWAGEITTRVQDSALKDFGSNVDKVMEIGVEKDGGFRFLAE